MILISKLNKINEPYTDLMNEWLNDVAPQFEEWEPKNFDRI